MLYLKLLGGFELWYQDEVVTGLGGHKAQALLAYLFLFRSSPVSRQRLAFTLWPDVSEQHAYGSMRKTLHSLRSRVPQLDRFVTSDRHSIHWLPEAPISVDVATFESLIARREFTQDALQQVSQLYRGPLLPDLDEEWLTVRRTEYQLLFQGYLREGIAQLEAQRHYADAITLTQRLLELDNYNEDVQRTLMRLQALHGDRAAALRTYHSFAKTLRRELAVVPDVETRTAYQRILKGESPALEGQKESPSRARTSNMVGRQAEWARLLSQWEQARMRGPLSVVIRSEVGLGKTRLAEEFSDWLLRQGLNAAVISCYPLERETPYAGLLSLLKSLPLQKLSPGHQQELSLLLPSGPIEAADRKTSWQVLPSRRQHIFEAATAALRAQEPLLLVIDSVEWCDVETLDWLRGLFHQVSSAPILVLFLLRPHDAPSGSPVSRLLNALKSMERLEEMDLPALTPQETSELAMMLAREPLAPERLAAVVQESEGNPLFVQELARAECLDGAAKGELTLPSSFQSVWETRLSVLTEPARALLTCAAVMGRAVSEDVLRQVSGMDFLVFLDALDLLLARGVLVEGIDNTLRFSHCKLADFIYSGLTRARRRHLHLQVTRVLSSAEPDTVARLESELALHFEKAGELREATQHSLRAAQNACRMFAWNQARRCYEQAIRLATELDDLELKWNAWEGLDRLLDAEARYTEQPEAHRQLQQLALNPRANAHWLAELRRREGLRLYRLGHSRRALSVINTALLLAQASGHKESELNALIMSANIRLQLGLTGTEALDELRRAVELARELQNEFLRIDAESLLAYQLYTRSRFTEASEEVPLPEQGKEPSSDVWRTAHNHAVSNGEPGIPVPKDRPSDLSVQRTLLARSARLKLIQGDFGSGIIDLRSAWDIAHQMKDHFTQSYLETWLGIAYYLKRHVKEARAHFASSLKLSREMAIPRRQTLNLGWMTEIELDLGNFRQAQRYLDESKQVFEDGENPCLMAYLFATQARYWLLQGDDEATLREVEEALEFQKANQVEKGAEVCLYLWSGQALLRQGRLEEAQQRLEQSASLELGIDHWLYGVSRTVSQAELLRRSGHLTRAEKLLKPLVDRLYAQKTPYIRPEELLIEYATLLQAQERYSEAKKAIVKARQSLMQLTEQLETPTERRMLLEHPSLARLRAALRELEPTESPLVLMEL